MNALDTALGHTGGGTLEGTVALVTGASSGIGRATAQALSAQGATVALVARRADRLKELADEILDAGGRAVVVVADVADEDRAREAVEEVVRQCGRLDTVVNNAGVMLLGPVRGAPREEWRRMVDINVRGLLAVTHASVEYLVEAARSGPRQVADLVNVSSIAGRTARVGTAVYNLTKWGVGAFSEALRQELAPEFVRVSVIEPGATTTELITHVRPEVREQSASRTAGVERLQAAHIASSISYMVCQPRGVAVNEIMIRPTNQVY
ncbi:SDR family NAD(P)-dependent oxidoreductase [Arthrobacter sp. I2-34]|uniref:SDR family NAD(P)-dependent oxidoreductase n=1 Tax=Arthrobacter hankyongi TaxID=2904801 RepID=A0ABS9L3Z5_9MICC|nr:SDR family NAD(P)-dependent oxidoreductase [Arthrobacter hankyongi]MCG2621336.1 SDR family NAD(P)-dependent oxidoreductase [Arthrobacter hankyongi]